MPKRETPPGDRRGFSSALSVMPGRVPGIHDFGAVKVVDPRDKPGGDGKGLRNAAHTERLILSYHLNIILPT